MNLVLLVLAVSLVIALVVVVTRPDPDAAIADRMEHLAEPWRELASNLGFGFNASYDDVRRAYSLRGSRGGRAVTVEYGVSDLPQQLRGFARDSKVDPGSRVKVTVHLLGGLPEGLRIRHDPTFMVRVASADDIQIGDPYLDEALAISGTIPSVVRAFVRRSDVQPLLTELTEEGHGSLLTEFELMFTRAEAEDACREAVEQLVEHAVSIAERVETVATREWRSVAEEWGLELILGSGGQPPLLVGNRDGADVRATVAEHGPRRHTVLQVGWTAGLPQDFRVVHRAQRVDGDVPLVELEYPPLDDEVRVFGHNPAVLRALLVDPHVAQAVLAVIQPYPSAIIDAYGVQVALPGDADAGSLSHAIAACLTLARRLGRQALAVRRPRPRV